MQGMFGVDIEALGLGFCYMYYLSNCTIKYANAILVKMMISVSKSTVW